MKTIIVIMKSEQNWWFPFYKPLNPNGSKKFQESIGKMEWGNRVMSIAARAANNNTVINVLLVGSFAALTVRSVNQQRNIEALEAEKESLVKTNKALKKTVWDWKQQLFGEPQPVPLARLKAIYGEAPPLQTG